RRRAFRLWRRGAPLRLAAAELLRPLALAALRLSLGPRRLGGLLHLLLGLLGLRLGRGGSGLLRPAAPTAATAAASGLRGGARLSRLRGGLWGYGLGCFNGRGRLKRRLLLLLLSASKPAQAKSPSCARAAATPADEAARSVRGKLWSEWNI